MGQLNAIIICMLLASTATAYVPVKFMNGGRYKCVDNATTCIQEGYFYGKMTGKTIEKEVTQKNTKTPTYLLLGVISAFLILIIYKAGDGGKTCIIHS